MDSLNILAIVDRPPKKPIKQWLTEKPIDLIITLGDLTYFDLAELKDIGIPKIGVYGNHDTRQYMEKLGGLNLHLKTWEYKGWIFGGFEGSVRYKPGDHPMFTQEEATALMAGFPYVDIFIAHAPLRGINDEEEVDHQGFDALKNYVENKRPKYFLHGHTYPTEKTIIDRLGQTKIIYISEDKYITLEK